ncbi:MFS transporter [Arthrobacter sp. GCM10027362]|uniref:MFS transporter n=1 Tax=Arthrobacter sp. GCM10027362 TaxID=3273379 RepID=UPI00362AB540
MSTTEEPAGALPQATRQEERKVLAGTLVGTTIEWYDFFIYAQAAGLVLAGLYFAPLAEENAALAQIISWATLGISFLFRPLGAIVAGHLGDRLGRKKMLVFTLVTMGAATTLIGLLPAYAQIGVWAPILLVLFRILQGFSAGGEWGGAALMSVEHAPRDRRGYFGAYPQIGVPCGMILATAVMFIATSSMSQEAFLAWGWRIPFLCSVLLIVVGYLIRRAVDESPVFKEMLLRKKESATPLGQLFRHNSKEVILTALIFIANNAAGYLLIAFFSSYATRPVQAGGLGMDRGPVLLATIVAAFGWLIFTLFGGMISDRLGRIRTFQIGYALLLVWAVPMFLLIDTANILWFAVAAFVLTIGLGLSYGPQSALYAEMFPVNVRYSGVSIGYAIGAILGGAFAPLVAELLLAETGTTVSIGIYIAALCIVSLIAVSVVKETRGANLRVEEAHQEYLRTHPEAAQ